MGSHGIIRHSHGKVRTKGGLHWNKLYCRIEIKNILRVSDHGTKSTKLLVLFVFERFYFWNLIYASLQFYLNLKKLT